MKRFFAPVLCVIITHTLVAGRVGAAVTAFDDFSSGTLSGGTGWTNSWSGGTVIGGALNHISGNPQQVSRNFTPPVLTAGPQGSPAGFYSVQMDVSLDYSPVIPNQNHGIRITQEGPSNGTFVAVWKNDNYAGQLTFLTGNSVVTLTGADWNISSTYNNNTSFKFTFDVVVLNGQNPGQYQGTYKAQVVRNDGVTFTTESLPWVNTNPTDANVLSRILFQNTSPQTILAADNLRVGNTSLAVPEPGNFVLLGLAAMIFAKRKRRLMD